MEAAKPMLADDVFRTRRDRTVAALQQWQRSLADCAHIEEEHAATFWRLSVSPLTEWACPFEVILHDRQTCDLAIGPESYEGRTSAELDRLPAMAEAIAAGRVLTRTKSSALTGVVLAIETEIRMADGDTWKADRWLVPGIRPRAMVIEDHWYLPYRR